MATLKLKPKPSPAGAKSTVPLTARPPVRGSGSGVRSRPTLAEAQTQRAEREARYQEQLRLRESERKAPTPGRRPPADRAPSDRPVNRDRGSDRSGRRPAPTWNEPQDGAPHHAFDPGPRPAPRTAPRPSRPPLPPARPVRPQREPPVGSNTAFGARPPPRDDTPPPVRRARPQRVDPEQHHEDRDDRPAPTNAPGSLRLSKYMGELGIASRREADEWIAKGWVRVDGRVVSELGSRVVPGQHVTVDAKARYVQAQKVTVLINKPVGYVSGQAEDGYEPALVLVKPANQWTEDRSGTRFLPQHLRSLVPAGRLDIDSVGLLVLTQDGRVAKQLIGENSPVEKEYLVRVASADPAGLSDDGLALLRHGLELDGEPLREALVEWVNEDQLRFVLREGKKRQIRRMCEAVGLQVLGLKRVRIGKLMLGDLPPGQWRYLRADEGFV